MTLSEELLCIKEINDNELAHVITVTESVKSKSAVWAGDPGEAMVQTKFRGKLLENPLFLRDSHHLFSLGLQLFAWVPLCYGGQPAFLRVDYFYY